MSVGQSQSHLWVATSHRHIQLRQCSASFSTVFTSYATSLSPRVLFPKPVLRFAKFSRHVYCVTTPTRPLLSPTSSLQPGRSFLEPAEMSLTRLIRIMTLTRMRGWGTRLRWLFSRAPRGLSKVKHARRLLVSIHAKNLHCSYSPRLRWHLVGQDCLSSNE